MTHFCYINNTEINSTLIQAKNKNNPIHHLKNDDNPNNHLSYHFHCLLKKKNRNPSNRPAPLQSDDDNVKT